MTLQNIKSFPFPKKIKNLPDIEKYLKALYGSLVEDQNYVPTVIQDHTAIYNAFGVISGITNTVTATEPGDTLTITMSDGNIVAIGTAATKYLDLALNPSPSVSTLNITQSPGTAPMIVASTTRVTNLNADCIDNQHISWDSDLNMYVIGDIEAGGGGGGGGGGTPSTPTYDPYYAMLIIPGAWTTYDSSYGELIISSPPTTYDSSYADLVISP